MEEQPYCKWEGGHSGEGRGAPGGGGGTEGMGVGGAAYGGKHRGEGEGGHRGEGGATGGGGGTLGILAGTSWVTGEGQGEDGRSGGYMWLIMARMEGRVMLCRFCRYAVPKLCLPACQVFPTPHDREAMYVYPVSFWFFSHKTAMKVLEYVPSWLVSRECAEPPYASCCRSRMS
jgi:hypothetical protein